MNALWLILTAIILVLMMSGIQYGHAQNPDNRVYPLGSMIDGKTYSQWSAEWWKWFASIENSTNPGNDSTGRFCGINQTQNIWFLTLTFGSGLEFNRTCTVPKDKPIFVPLLSSICDQSEVVDVNKESLQCAIKYNGGMGNGNNSCSDASRTFNVALDGKKFENVENYRSQTPLLNVTYPENNVYGANPGTYQAMGDGFYLILKPLSAGKHELTIYTVLRVTPISGINSCNAQNVIHDVKYHLISK